MKTVRDSRSSNGTGNDSRNLATDSAMTPTVSRKNRKVVPKKSSVQSSNVDSLVCLSGIGPVKSNVLVEPTVGKDVLDLISNSFSCNRINVDFLSQEEKENIFKQLISLPEFSETAKHPRKATVANEELSNLVNEFSSNLAFNCIRQPKSPEKHPKSSKMFVNEIFFEHNKTQSKIFKDTPNLKTLLLEHIHQYFPDKENDPLVYEAFRRAIKKNLQTSPTE